MDDRKKFNFSGKLPQKLNFWPRRRWLVVVALALAAVAIVVGMAAVLPPGVDWDKTFYPAARQALSLRNPYSAGGPYGSPWGWLPLLPLGDSTASAANMFYNPPWTLLPLLPLALLPPNVGRAAHLLLSLLAFGYAAYKLGAKPLALGAFLASPPVLHCLLNANVDWMPVLGFVLPPQLGLFFVVIKPQLGSAVVLFWLVESWRKGGFKETLRVFAPVSLAYALSYLVFGYSPLGFNQDTLGLWWNASLWPMSIPVGLGLLAAALRKREIRYAMGAAPCLSPYVLFHSWSGALVAIVANQFETLAVVAGLWALVLLRSLGG